MSQRVPSHGLEGGTIPDKSLALCEMSGNVSVQEAALTMGEDGGLTPAPGFYDGAHT
jgi:hypothetical protein